MKAFLVIFWQIKAISLPRICSHANQRGARPPGFTFPLQLANAALASCRDELGNARAGVQQWPDTRGADGTARSWD